MKNKNLQPNHPMQLKMQLAWELVKIAYNAEIADRTWEEFELVFRKNIVRIKNGIRQ